MSRLPGNRLMDQVSEFIDQICQRWSEALQRYRQEVSDDEDFTYRAVLGAKGLFGDSVGALEQNDRARQLLVDILERACIDLHFPRLS